MEEPRVPAGDGGVAAASAGPAPARPPLGPPSGSPLPSVGLKRNRNKPPPLMVPEEAKTPYSVTNAGVFSEGDLTISRAGLQIGDMSGSLAGPLLTPMRLDSPLDGAAPLLSSRSSTSSMSDANVGMAGGAGVLPGSAGGTGGAGTASGSRQGSAAAARPGQVSAGSDAQPTSRGSDDSGLFDSITLEDLRPLGIIGTGSSGVVQKVQHIGTGDILAVKIIQMDVQEAARKQILMELRTLRQSSYKHIVPCFGAFFSEGAVSIVLEHMDGGSLGDLTKRRGPLPERYLAEVARQVLCGLQYLHKDLHVVHRDVKPSNLLVNTRGEVKISDFGVSGQLANSISKCASWVGTVTYMSPERISGKPYAFDSDVWSLGLSLVECALGRFPYPPPADAADAAAPPKAPMGFWDLLDYIVERPAPALPAGGAFSEELRAFVSLCLRKEPSERPPVTELLSHPFILLHTGPGRPPVDLADIIPPGGVGLRGQGGSRAAAGRK